MGILANLRNGICKHIITYIPGTNIKVALVQLNNKTIVTCREKAMAYITKHTVDADTADIIFNTYVLEKAMRNPENLDEEISEFDEINENLTTTEIYELHYKYLEVQNGTSEDIEEMTEEELEEIKKNLDQILLSDLDGELQTILRYFHQMLTLRNLPQDK
ncbi:hypothetical protein [Tepidibacter hydrothermalis]|uniref:Uncharacterized protein n=1 Tax=Tepidibacter hydrothermalis TaxID=3036126 RepID=A0ABY8EHN7_9FIRM|nr:hypothetical protein [Tepidibacter hydrothermalis]WFD12456.1 hypothetical protein P4S50_19955 [Tepidibacter hydrothermalis]